MDIKELIINIKALGDEESHDYGSAADAVAKASVMTFNYMAGHLGITGFQAGWAQMAILRELRGLNHGFRILDYEKLLYPQYCTEEYFPSIADLENDPEIRKHLSKEAKKRLTKDSHVHPEVKARWEEVAGWAE
jgi:hypothetical protein